MDESETIPWLSEIQSQIERMSLPERAELQEILRRLEERMVTYVQMVAHIVEGRSEAYGSAWAMIAERNQGWLELMQQVKEFLNNS